MGFVEEHKQFLGVCNRRCSLVCLISQNGGRERERERRGKEGFRVEV